jgi:hypothetical protein
MGIFIGGPSAPGGVQGPVNIINNYFDLEEDSVLPSQFTKVWYETSLVLSLGQKSPLTIFQNTIRNGTSRGSISVLDATDEVTIQNNLIELGAKAVVFMPIGFATENHETLLDVEHIIESLQRKHPNTCYMQMECVNDNPEFCQMAADWAIPHIQALLFEQNLAVNPNITVSNHTHSHDHHHHNGHHHH